MPGPKRYQPGNNANGSDYKDAKRFKSTQTKSFQKPATTPVILNRKEKKEQLVQQKTLKNKNYTLIQEVTTLWEELRRHDISKEKRTSLVSKILAKTKGRIPDLAGSRKAARVIQCCIKYGTANDRKIVLNELQPKLLDLAKSPFGHFVVSKLINTAASKKDLLAFYKAYRGHYAEMLRHPAAAHVVDDLYLSEYTDTSQRNSMTAEFYGREYSLFEGGLLNNLEGPPAHLSDLLAAVDGNKQKSIMQQLAADLSPIFEKGLVDAQLSHRLAAEYLANAPAGLVIDAVESLSGEALLHMLHTKDGATAACMVIGYGSAKERKKAVKAMKGHVGTAVVDEWGHLAIATALSVVDDTVILNKFIISAIQKDLATLVDNRYAHRVILQLLHPYCNRYIPPQLLSIMKPKTKQFAASSSTGNKTTEAEEAADDKDAGADNEDEESNDDEDEEEGEGTTKRQNSGILGQSKKDDIARRLEIFGSGPGSFSSALLDLCTSHCEEMLTSQWGCDVLIEVCRGGEGGVLLQKKTTGDADGEEDNGGKKGKKKNTNNNMDKCRTSSSLNDVHDAVVATVASSLQPPSHDYSPSEEEGEKNKEKKEKKNVLEDYFGSRALRRLVLASNDDATAKGLVEKLWKGALTGKCKEVYEGHGAKVVAALVCCGSEKVKKEVKKEMVCVVKDVEAWAVQFVKQHN